jgi:hypothetical protein
MSREGRACCHCPHQWLINSVASASSSTRHFRFLFLFFLVVVIIVIIVRVVLLDVNNIAQYNKRHDPPGQNLPYVDLPQLPHQCRRRIDPLRHRSTALSNQPRLDPRATLVLIASIAFLGQISLFR